MTFGEALEALKQRKFIARDIWHGDQFLFLVPAMGMKSIADVWPDGVQGAPCLYCKMLTYVIPWTPTHLDLLADDWKLVSVPAPLPRAVVEPEVEHGPYRPM